MKTFPMFLQMQGRRVVIVGGGEQAAQKCRLILKTEAEIIVHAPNLDPELAALQREGRITWHATDITPDAFKNSALVFIATGCRGADTSLHMLAKAAGAVVNVVDQPALCDAITPSIVDRSPVVIAIGTEGTAPVLARQIKTRMEELLEPRLGDLAALAGRLRDRAAHRLQPRARRDLWRWVFSGPVRRAHANGQERDVAKMIKTAIDTASFGAHQTGSVAVVGAGPGAKDLITLRGVQRLQEADVIYYDEQIEPEVLELARRDAERVFIESSRECHPWHKDCTTRIIATAARNGQRVVWLKSGDPAGLGDAHDDLQALQASGVAIEVVAGVASEFAQTNRPDMRQARPAV